MAENDLSTLKMLVDGLCDRMETAIAMIEETYRAVKDRPAASVGAATGGGGGGRGEAPEAVCFNITEDDDAPAVFRWNMPEGTKPAVCKYCKGPVRWVQSRNGKNIPLHPTPNKEGHYITHWDLCKEDPRKKQAEEDKQAEAGLAQESHKGTDLPWDGTSEVPF